MIDLPTTMACMACTTCATLVLAASVNTGDAPASGGTDTTPAPAAKATSEADSRAAAMAALDARYVVGPATADDFGYRIVWQTPWLRVTRASR